MENNEYGAAQALHDLGEGRAAAARRVITPWWYHPLIGLALAGLVAGLSRGASRLLTGLSIFAFLVLIALYRRLTGMWVDLRHVPELARPCLVAVVVAYAVLGGAALLEHGARVPYALVVAGLLLGAAYVVFWRWVERRLVALWER